MDPKAQKWYGIVAAAVVVIAALGWYFAVHQKAVAPSTNTNATSTTATSTGGLAGVQSIPDQSTLKKPDLNRPYTPLATLPQSVQNDNKKMYAAAVEQLKFDPNGIGYWLQLAQLRKGANDFTGAEEVWLYVTARFTKDPIAFNNLGDLYAFSLKNSAKAVEYWNKAIAIAPKGIATYINLATFQSVNLGDKAAAKATLQAGLKANPGNANLQNALDNL